MTWEYLELEERRQTRKENDARIKVLEMEIDVLKSRYEPHDTGHLRTTVSVLERRVKELHNEG